MNDSTATRLNPNYRYALLGGLIYSLPTAINGFAGNNLAFSYLWQFLLPIFAGGTLICAAALLVLRAMPSRRHQNMLIATMLIIGTPLIFFGYMLGGLLGAPGILINNGIVAAVLLLSCWFVLYRPEGLRIRLIIALLAAGALLSWAYIDIRSQRSATGATGHCEETIKHCPAAATLAQAQFRIAVDS